MKKDKKKMKQPDKDALQWVQGSHFVDSDGQLWRVAFGGYTAVYRCKTCDKPAFANSDLCCNCWEVERRLEEYLQSEKGRDLVQVALNKVLSQSRRKT